MHFAAALTTTIIYITDSGLHKLSFFFFVFPSYCLYNAFDNSMLLADMPLSRLCMKKKQKKSPQTNNSGTAHLKNLCPRRRFMYDNQKLREMGECVISRMFCPSFSKLVRRHWSAVRQGCSPSLSACDKSDIAAETLLHFLSALAHQDLSAGRQH